LASRRRDADGCEWAAHIVTIKENVLTLPGTLIERVGLCAPSKGDTSDPGLVLMIRKAG
jgi:hypothetical protein